jgi:alanine racemase
MRVPKLMSRPTKAIIHLDALRHNLHKVREYAPHSKILAMVKANAYGHHAHLLTSALANADALGVACLEEALSLRAQGVEQPLVLMEGFFTADELPVIAQDAQMAIVLHTNAQIDSLRAYAQSATFTCWLKINTGMHRLGFAVDEVAQVWEQLQQMPAIRQPIGWMTHFAEADAEESNKSAQQYHLFEQALAGRAGPKSLANSAAILRLPQTHQDWVRPGIMLYGVSPFANHIGKDHGLQPVMTLRSRLIAIQHCKRGDCVGYGGAYQCPEDMPIGVVAVGYGDGYPRHCQTGTPVLVKDKLVPLVGRVSMDMITVDLRLLPEAQVGDEVTLWGEDLPVEKVAHAAGTIAYELLCGVQRAQFICQ